jgi:hypothetical protein
LNVIVVMCGQEAPARCRLLLDRVAGLLPFPDFTQQVWSSTNERVVIASFARASAPYVASDYFHVGPTSGALTTYTGWLTVGGRLDRSMQTLGPSFGFDVESQPGEVTGEYLVVRADAGGRGACWRSAGSGPPLYRGGDDRFFTLSNRAALVALVANGVDRIEVDRTFAAWLLGVGWPLSDATLWKGVEALGQWARVGFSEAGVRVRRPPDDPWYDEGQRRRFHASPKLHWDAVFDRLRGAVSSLDALAGAAPVTLRLSGGKDSRVLLGLLDASRLLERVEAVTVRGHPFAPDVVVASRMAADRGLRVVTVNPYEAVDRYDEHILEHAFLTEATISPYDLCWHRTMDPRGVILFGQEGGALRDLSRAASLDASSCRRWFSRYYSDLDVLGILKPSALASTRESLHGWIENALSTTADPADIPTRHRLETRLRRWAGTVQACDSTRGLTPYFLALDATLVSQYSVGAKVRTAEVFHYEMLRRCDRRLADAYPFAEVGWPGSGERRPSSGDRFVFGFFLDTSPTVAASRNHRGRVA